MSFFTEQNAERAQAGDCLQCLANAIAHYSRSVQMNKFFMVLVDECDKPLCETLFWLFENTAKSAVTPCCLNCISFFNICKSIREVSGNKVWITGVAPIALDLIGDFKPKNLTFKQSMSNAVGLWDEDVDHMLNCVHMAKPFDGDEEKGLVPEAIWAHVNYLQFGMEPHDATPAQ